MTRYHINPETGTPGRCNPEKTGVCLYGEDQAHYTSREDALYAAEVAFTEENGGSFGPKTRSSLTDSQRAAASALRQAPKTEARQNFSDKLFSAIETASDKLSDFSIRPGPSLVARVVVVAGILGASGVGAYAAHMAGETVVETRAADNEIVQIYSREGMVENHRPRPGHDTINVRFPNGEVIAIRGEVTGSPDFVAETLSAASEGKPITVSNVKYNDGGEEKVVENLVFETPDDATVLRALANHEGGSARAFGLGGAVAMVALGVGGAALGNNLVKTISEDLRESGSR